MKPVLAVTMGDFNGVGPEVVIKASLSPAVRGVCRPLLVGSLDVFEHYARTCKRSVLFREITADRGEIDGPGIPVVEVRPYERPVISPGLAAVRGGVFAGESLRKAVRLWSQGMADAVVTAPTSKSVMQKAGFRFPGQTEMVAAFSGGKRPLMMLVAGTFRVALATVHLPLKVVSRTLSKQLIVERLRRIHDSLRIDFRLKHPRIAVLGLNPHAGENGLLGNEEQRLIAPAIRLAVRSGIRAEGPFPADGFFGTHAHRKYDAVLAMYHDQGLIPLKMWGFETGVNYSAGLPVIRTSPDHGTAYELAGRGGANPNATIAAMILAASIVKNRRAFSRYRAKSIGR
jgi:4-phospho-D-threonate 3-dehydrogenase / 4-phospho-D-erythronate 3-dehydrogenase